VTFRSEILGSEDLLPGRPTKVNHLRVDSGHEAGKEKGIDEFANSWIQSTSHICPVTDFTPHILLIN
jgi:hypothetical protein